MPSRATPIILGIAGGTGSGKTTVANVILERVGAGRIVLLAHDAYYRDLRDLPRAQRDIINFDTPTRSRRSCWSTICKRCERGSRSRSRSTISPPTPAPT